MTTEMRSTIQLEGSIERARKPLFVALRLGPRGSADLAADVAELLHQRQLVPASGGERGVERTTRRYTSCSR